MIIKIILHLFIINNNKKWKISINFISPSNVPSRLISPLIIIFKNEVAIKENNYIKNVKILYNFIGSVFLDILF